MSESKSVIDTGVTETTVQEDYFALRQLKKGAVGWLLLVGLGVAYVISGDFAGWILVWLRRVGAGCLLLLLWWH